MSPAGFWPRTLIQALFLIWVIYLGLAHQMFGIERVAPIDGFCPFGGVETFLTLLATGQFIQRIYWGSIILMFITVGLTLVGGRVFCGFICPLGTMQEWIRALGRRTIAKKDREIPKHIDSKLRFAKYAVLIAVLYFTYSSGDLMFRYYDPYNALMHFGEEFDEKVIGYGVLALTFLFAVFYKNLWCRYLCPLGAFYGIISKLKRFILIRDEKRCIDCGRCNSACPHGIDVQHQKKTKDVDCVSCLNCVSVCPKNCIEANVAGKRIKDQNTLAIAAAFVFLSFVGFSMLGGIWISTPASNIISDDGSIDVDNIRGSNTLEYLVKTSNVSLEVFMEELGLPEDVDTGKNLKYIGSDYGLKNAEGATLEVEDFREVVRKYLKKP